MEDQFSLLCIGSMHNVSMSFPDVENDSTILLLICSRKGCRSFLIPRLWMRWVYDCVVISSTSLPTKWWISARRIPGRAIGSMFDFKKAMKQRFWSSPVLAFSSELVLEANYYHMAVRSRDKPSLHSGWMTAFIESVAFFPGKTFLVTTILHIFNLLARSFYYNVSND